MWATIKNYATIPNKGRYGMNPALADELPFSPSFTENDRKHLLKRSSKSQISKAARRKLMCMIALGEDPDCFAYLQSKLRDRNVCTHQTVAEMLRNDTSMLDLLSTKVMDNGVTLNTQQQLQHGIITAKTAAGHNHMVNSVDANGSGVGGMSLLNNLKGLIIHQDEEYEDEPANPYVYTSKIEHSTKDNTKNKDINTPSYFVVSTPHTHEQSKRDRHSSINGHTYNGNHYNFNNAMNGGGKGDKRCSLSTYMSQREASKRASAESHGIFGGKSRGSGVRAASMATASTARSSVSSGTYSARDSIASSASDWFCTALPMTVTGLRHHNSSEPDVIINGTRGGGSPYAPTRAVDRRATSDGNPSSSWFQHQQVNMSSRQMSESLQNTLQHAHACSKTSNSDHVNVNTTTGSCHVASSNAMAEFFGSSSSLMRSFGDSQDLEPGTHNTGSTSTLKRMGGSGLQAALNFTRVYGNGPRRGRRGSHETPSPANKIVAVESAPQLPESLCFEDSTNHIDSFREEYEHEQDHQVADDFDIAEPDGDMPMLTLAQRRQMKKMTNEHIGTAGNNAQVIMHQVREEDDNASDDEDQSVLLVGFPSKLQQGSAGYEFGLGGSGRGESKQNNLLFARQAASAARAEGERRRSSPQPKRAAALETDAGPKFVFFRMW